MTLAMTRLLMCSNFLFPGVVGTSKMGNDTSFSSLAVRVGLFLMASANARWSREARIA